ncbi:MAG: hypothetical protein N4A68_07475 [Maledivibacter sp.]|jgi:hypothetical protein|nr:hypothetical protein [Maledivibacter sp.]
MKKIIIAISILLIATLSFLFFLKPSEDNQKNMVSIGKMNIQSFDLYNVLEKVTGDDPSNSDLFFEDFSMTVTDKKNVVSLNFSFFEDRGFGREKTNVHLYGINDTLIVKNESLDDGKDFSIKEYIFSIFNVRNTRNQRKGLYAEHYFHQDSISALIENLRESFIDDINTEKDRLHIDLMPRAYHTIFNNDNDIEIYLVNIYTGNITNIKDIRNDKNIQTVFEKGILKSYKINNLGGLCSYTDSNGKFKYYFFEEN